LLLHHLKYQTKKFDIGTNEIRQDNTKLDGNTQDE